MYNIKTFVKVLFIGIEVGKKNLSAPLSLGRFHLQNIRFL